MKPSLAIRLLVLVFKLLGAGLRNALVPRQCQCQCQCQCSTRANASDYNLP